MVQYHLSECPSVALFQNILLFFTDRSHVYFFHQAIAPLRKSPNVFVSSKLSTPPKLIILCLPLPFLHPPINQLSQPKRELRRPLASAPVNSTPDALAQQIQNIDLKNAFNINAQEFVPT